jgi:hypothetical protein
MSEWRWAFRLALAVQLVLAVAAHGAEPTMRLRIAWGGGAERAWHGTARLSDGQFADLLPLGIEADEPGSIWLDGGMVYVQPPSRRAYDGLDVSLTADLNARLVVDLVDDSQEAEPLHVDVALRELVGQSHSSTMDRTGNRLLILRAPGDRLRVRLTRDSLVFAPGESFKVEVRPQLLEATSKKSMRIAAHLTNAAGAQVWSSPEQPVSVAENSKFAEQVSLEVSLPMIEGVYDLKVELVIPRLRKGLPWKKSVAERKVQLVVVDKRRAPQSATAPAMTKVLEIDPVNSRWWERFTNLPLVPGWRKGPLGSGDWAPWEHPKLGQLSQLGQLNPPGAERRAPAISWEAYPLPLANPGQPHILEIEYPSDVPQTMGISLLEPNAAGAVMPIGLDSGVYVGDDEAEEAGHLAKHRVVFWPRTKAPLLLITNRREGSRAVYGKIRVLAVAASTRTQFASLPLGWQDNTQALLPRAFAPGPVERLWAGYMDRPLLGANFSANEALDASSGRCLDDWTTFYQGATRLTEYLNYVGYNALMINVLAEGSTIYPARRVAPTPRFDTGVFLATGQDPVRKDALELLFRLFDREGLQLIPSVQFTAPLPELEALRRQDPDGASGVEWIGGDGPVRRGRQSASRSAPFYNPLNPRVQQAMISVIDELATRYGSHPSFGGVAVQLSADGYAQLPPVQGGYDDDTIAHFTRDTKMRVPGAGPDRYAARAAFFNGPASRAWLNWRAAALADFHRRTAQVVTRARPGARLYLAGGHMLDNSQIQHSLRPALPPRMNVDEVLLNLGLRAPLYRDQDGIVFLRPQRISPPGSLTANGADLEVNLSPEVDRLFSGGRDSASLFYHEPQKARLASFDAKSPFGPANTYTWLVSQISPSGDRNRRRFVHSLATLDAQQMFDGGWLLALGQEDASRELLGIYRQLPAARFETVPGESQPVTIRTVVRGSQTFAYLVNDSPWAATVNVQVEMPAGCRLETLGGGKVEDSLLPKPPGAVWSVKLKAFDLVAVAFSAPGVRLSRPEVKLADEVRVVLEQRIQDLRSRAEALLNPVPMHVLENPSFELPSTDNRIPGWSVDGGDGAAAVLDRQEKPSGTQSLHVSSEGRPISLHSNPFEPPHTGRLSVSVQLRVADAARQPPLRLAIEGKLGDKDYYRFAAVGSADTDAVPLAKEWASYDFKIDDLPAEGLTDLRVRLDLLGAGEVWIHDIEIFDLAFTPEERVALTKIILLTSYKLQAGQVADCARLLEGYWPQFLLAHVALAENPLPLAQRPRPTGTPEPAQPPPAKKPGMLDKVKGFVPKPLQF